MILARGGYTDDLKKLSIASSVGIIVLIIIGENCNYACLFCLENCNYAQYIKKIPNRFHLMISISFIFFALKIDDGSQNINYQYYATGQFFNYLSKCPIEMDRIIVFLKVYSII